METTEPHTNAIAYKRVINATIEVDNSTDETRTADIVVELVVDNGKLYAVNNGRITALPDDSGSTTTTTGTDGRYPVASPQPLATFGLNPDGSMWQQIANPDNAINLQPQIINFLSAVRTNVEAGITTLI